MAAIQCGWQQRWPATGRRQAAGTAHHWGAQDLVFCERLEALSYGLVVLQEHDLLLSADVRELGLLEQDLCAAQIRHLGVLGHRGHRRDRKVWVEQSPEPGHTEYG